MSRNGIRGTGGILNNPGEEHLPFLSHSYHTFVVITTHTRSKQMDAVNSALARLSKTDLKALREADSISFTYIAGREMGEITCRKRIRNPGPLKIRKRNIPFLSCVRLADNMQTERISPQRTQRRTILFSQHKCQRNGKLS
jgi:hypothetical protein